LDGKMVDEAFDEEHLQALVFHYFLLAADPTPKRDHDFLMRLVSLMLTLASVAPAPRVDEAPGPLFVVPAVRRLPDGSWLINGLLPLLAVATAQRLEPAEFYPCTRCGELARLRDRRPTAGKPWFGDHDECRAAARADSMRKANARRSQHEDGQP
ncbi:MAG TPA: hypothetical protein VFQ80_04055, partial [Thermomicrobiales bacterium]|nr:hypothetical protein [Thermomicrobiales bacterium]